jgi:hypothetical protein
MALKKKTKNMCHPRPSLEPYREGTRQRYPPGLTDLFTHRRIYKMMCAIGNLRSLSQPHPQIRRFGHAAAPEPEHTTILKERGERMREEEGEEKGSSERHYYVGEKRISF